MPWNSLRTSRAKSSRSMIIDPRHIGPRAPQWNLRLKDKTAHYLQCEAPKIAKLVYNSNLEIGLLTGLRAHGHTRNPRAHGHTRNPRAHGHTRNPRPHGRRNQWNSGNVTESWQHCGGRTASPQKGIYSARSHSNAWRNDLRSRQTTTLRCTQTTPQESTKLR